MVGALRGWTMKMVENITQAILSPSSEPRWPCPGSSRDRCQHCGGWISLGHARGSSCREEADAALRALQGRPISERR
nr:hypothetical protein CFP56_74454 [Quercus suber]